MCVFDFEKQCDDCNECNICDLDKNKICNNCSKCLELEGMDTRAIKIDEISEENEIEYFQGDDNLKDSKDDEFLYDFIDDIQDIDDILKKENEEYPGLFKIKN